MVPPDGLAVRVIDWPWSTVGEAGVGLPAESRIVTVKSPVIVPVPLIVAVVDSVLAEVMAIDPVLALHEENDQKMPGSAAIEITEPESYQPVSPLMGGAVLVEALPPSMGLAANKTWNCTSGVDVERVNGVHGDGGGGVGAHCRLGGR